MTLSLKLIPLLVVFAAVPAFAVLTCISVQHDLASRASDSMHGAVVPVDGGWLAR
jgi:hypothetical protein